MRFMQKAKDGGHKSPVDAYFLFESKSFGSVALLKFHQGGREAFHTHAFNAYTWFLCGDLIEEDYDGSTHRYHRSLSPKRTPREKNHRVRALRTSWCFTIRGPWSETWTEHQGEVRTLFGWGRKVLKTSHEARSNGTA